MAWNWRKDWSVMGLLRMLVLFFLLSSWCKFPSRGFISANWWSNRQQWCCIKAMNRPRCFQNSCSLCLGCGRRLINFTESIFSPKWSWSVLEWRLPVPVWREMFNFSAAAQQPVRRRVIFHKLPKTLVRNTFAGDGLAAEFDNLIVHCAIRSTLKVIAKAKTKKIQTKIWGISSGGFCAWCVFFFLICAQSTLNFLPQILNLLSATRPPLTPQQIRLKPD